MSRHSVLDDVQAAARCIADEVAAPAADLVDRDSRFPKESIDALREAGLLGAFVPAEFGGAGASLSEIGAATATLARACATTAMVYAMHQIQVACLVRHGTTPAIRDYLRDQVVGQQVLLASATTEVGIGGDVRSSSCAVVPRGERIGLRKQAPVISYGDHADAILATARRTEDSPPNDQVLVVCRREDVSLEPVGEWDALGMRGTCSRGFVLDADCPAAFVLPDAYGDISARTMLPVSHVLWAHVWLGIAEESAGRAHAVVRAEARRKVGSTPPSALHLAELHAVLMPMRVTVASAAQRFDELPADSGELGSMSYALDANSLKVYASSAVVDVVNRSMRICGMAGYRENSEQRLGRLLRDAHSAAVMISNDRILANSAQLLLVVRDR